MTIIIHLGDAGTGTLKCKARATKLFSNEKRNWTWQPERVTCKKCLKIYKAKVRT